MTRRDWEQVRWNAMLGGRITRRDVLKRAGALGLTLPAAAGLLAACGGGEEGGGTGTEPTEGTTESPTTEAEGSPAASPTASGSPEGGASADLPTPPEGYPDKTVTFLAGSNPGSGWDQTARAVADTIQREKLMEEAPVVENVPGGGGSIALTRLITEHTDDPHFLQVTSTPILSTFVSGVTQYSFKDTQPVARLIADYYLFAVKADSDIQDFADFIGRLEQNPGSVRIAGSDAGSDDWVAAAAVFRKADIDFQGLTYAGFSGGAEIATAVLGGHADLGISGVGEFLQHIEAGTMRALAITAEERLETLPDIPTVKEQGWDAVWENWRGFVAPPEMPDEHLTYWQDLFAYMVETETWAEMRRKYRWGDLFMIEGFAEFLEERQNTIKEILEEAGAI